MKNNRKYGFTIAAFGLLAVVIGAFGAHGLKLRLTTDQMGSYQTGVYYHFFHLLAMVCALILLIVKEHRLFYFSFWAFAIGIVLFSGSIYLLSTQDLTSLPGMAILGPLTPVGGLCFMIGWSCLGLGLTKD